MECVNFVDFTLQYLTDKNECNCKSCCCLQNSGTSVFYAICGGLFYQVFTISELIHRFKTLNKDFKVENDEVQDMIVNCIRLGKLTNANLEEDFVELEFTYKLSHVDVTWSISAEPGDVIQNRNHVVVPLCLALEESQRLNSKLFSTLERETYMCGRQNSATSTQPLLISKFKDVESYQKNMISSTDSFTEVRAIKAGGLKLSENSQTLFVKASNLIDECTKKQREKHDDEDSETLQKNDKLNKKLENEKKECMRKEELEKRLERERQKNSASPVKKKKKGIL